MKTLGLLRHAKSDWDDMSLRDFDRGLNERGRRGAAAMGAHARRLGLGWDLAIASPAERVRATIAASGLGLAPEFDERLYLADAATLMTVLRRPRSFSPRSKSRTARSSQPDLACRSSPSTFTSTDFLLSRRAHRPGTRNTVRDAL